MFEEQLKKNKVEMTIKGAVKYYQCFDDVWRLLLENVLLKRRDGDRHEERAEGISLIAFPSKK